MGWRARRLPYGWLKWHDIDPGMSWGRVTLESEVSDADALLKSVRSDFADWECLRLVVDDAAQHERLDSGLRRLGYETTGVQVLLAHVGGAPERLPVADASVEEVEVVEADRLHEWASTKLRGFGDSDVEPDNEAVAFEVALHGAELRGELRLRLARVAGEPASIIGWYDEDDLDVFNLATRPAFRERGLARLLLSQVLREAEAEGRRSVVIGTDPRDTPIRWYRRFGFTDELLTAFTYQHQSRQS